MTEFLFPHACGEGLHRKRDGDGRAYCRICTRWIDDAPPLDTPLEDVPAIPAARVFELLVDALWVTPPHDVANEPGGIERLGVMLKSALIDADGRGVSNLNFYFPQPNTSINEES
ncbi:hypothetical protein SEA_DATBOI_144 [Gordonia phage DatBoi]|nr:hypothetical protein SEA_DATBOI_144 [Gordonia phage DatBoi]